MASLEEALDDEAQRATAILIGKIVKHVRRWSEHEVMIEFSDGARLYADAQGAASTKLELSITLSGELD